MAFQHGKNSVFKLDDSGGTLRDLSSYVDSVDLGRSQDNPETTTFGNSARTRIPGLVDGDIQISGSYDPTTTTGPDAVIAPLLGASVASTSMEYGPYGSTGGYVKYTAEVIIKDYKITGKVGDKVTFAASFDATGAVTRTTW